MKVTCERCMYWDNSHEEERAQGRSGFCRQSPPHPEWHWALTDPHDWCGQSMPKDARASKYYQEEDEDSEQCKQMPIETAPFNDTLALAWDEERGKWVIFDFDHDNDANWMRLRGYTHWYPLPEAPM